MAIRILNVEDRKKFLEQKKQLKKLQLKKLTDKNKLDIVRLLEKKENMFNRSILTWEKFYGEASEFPIKLYRKQRIFFECGRHFKVRAFSGGNRSSKSFSATTEVAFHSTGFYPSWWNGIKLNHKKNTTILCVSDDWKTSREVIQSYLLREEEGADNGTGFIPAHMIDWEKSKKVSKDTYDYIIVNRIDGGTCKIVFRSSGSGRKLFQGFKCDFVLFDEEPPLDVYSEALIRTTTTDGLVVIAYTPLSGVTPFIKEFLDQDWEKVFEYNDEPYKQDNIIFFDKYKERKYRSSKIYIRMGWADVPHLTEQQKRETLDGIPEWQWDARMNGIPIIGSGAIYPLKESDIVIQPFDIPSHWNRWYGLDVGTTCTAVSLFTQNPVDKMVYIYKEMSFYNNNGVFDYAQEIYKEVGSYQWGSIDHAANMGSQFDKKSIRKELADTGLVLLNANKSVNKGLTEVYKEFKQNRLKIFSNCINHIKELRTYRRNEKGEIIKKDDHHMDAMRYAMLLPEEKRNGNTTLTQIFREIDEIQDIETQFDKIIGL